MKPTLKPFDLERALAGDSVITREGMPVTQLHLFEANHGFPLMGVVDRELLAWTKRGDVGLFSYDVGGNKRDLFMAPVYNDVYVVVWLEDGVGRCSEFYLVGSAQTLISNLAKSGIKAQIVTFTVES